MDQLAFRDVRSGRFRGGNVLKHITELQVAPAHPLMEPSMRLDDWVSSRKVTIAAAFRERILAPLAAAPNRRRLFNDQFIISLYRLIREANDHQYCGWLRPDRPPTELDHIVSLVSAVVNPHQPNPFPGGLVLFPYSLRETVTLKKFGRELVLDAEEHNSTTWQKDTMVVTCYAARKV